MGVLRSKGRQADVDEELMDAAADDDYHGSVELNRDSQCAGMLGASCGFCAHYHQAYNHVRQALCINFNDITHLHHISATACGTRYELAVSGCGLLVS